MKLKETNHPYYSSSSNYYTNELSNNEYHSWNYFVDEWSPFDMDIDLNYIFRFDISEDDGIFTLELFIIHQRQGIYNPVRIHNIKDEDMIQITEMLKQHHEHSKSLWEEFCLGEEL